METEVDNNNILNKFRRLKYEDDFIVSSDIETNFNKSKELFIEEISGILGPMMVNKVEYETDDISEFSISLDIMVIEKKDYDQLIKMINEFSKKGEKRVTEEER